MEEEKGAKNDVGEEEGAGGEGLPSTVNEQKLHEAAEALAQAERIVVFSGAGISAESIYNPLFCRLRL